MSVITFDSALRIAQEFAQNLYSEYKESLLAVYAIGSLGGGYYRPGQSDIDTFIILGGIGRSRIKTVEEEINRLGDEYQRRYGVPKGFGAVVVTEQQLYAPYMPEEELALEIVRLKVQSRLVYGAYDLGRIPMPDRQALIDDANAFEDWRDSADCTDSASMTRQMCVNSILILLKRYLMIDRNIVELNKFKVIGAYMSAHPPYVNEEAFTLVQKYLTERESAISSSQLRTMIVYHEQLRRNMNSVLLGRESKSTSFPFC